MAEEQKNSDFTDDEKKLILFMGGDPDNFDDEDDEVTEGQVILQGCIVVLLALIGIALLHAVCLAG